MEPLLVQHHITKTAGTSLRHVTLANFRAGEVANLERTLRLERVDPGQDWERFVESYRRSYRSVDPRRKARIRCFIGHSAPLLRAVADDRAIRTFTMLRDPVERVISFYAHGKRLFEQGTARDTIWGPTLETMRERGWQLADVYRELGDAPDAPVELQRRFQPFFNWQAKQILAGTFDTREIPSTSDTSALAPYRDGALEILEDGYVVGVQDRFSQSVRLFADSFGWRRAFVPKLNTRPSDLEVDEGTRVLIRAYNSLDAELHARYSRALAGRPGVDHSTHLRGMAHLRARSWVVKARRLARTRRR